MSGAMKSGGYATILVRCTNWLGDAVMTTPFFAHLRRIFPGARITAMALPYIAPVFGNNPNIDEIVIVPERPKGFFAAVGAAAAILGRRGRRYDLGISLPNSFGAAFDLISAGCRRIAGYSRSMRGIVLDIPVRYDPGIYSVHEIFYYLNILREAVAPSDPVLAELFSAIGFDGRRFAGGDRASAGHEPPYELFLSPDERAAARERLAALGAGAGRVTVGVNPGAFFGSAKRWPTERYAQLISLVASRCADARFVIFGSAKESSIGSALCAASPGRVFDLCGKTSIRELMALIAGCDCFLTNDSGAMHIAAAFGVPLAAIFGPTDDRSTYPVCRDMVLVRHPVECSPCKKRECPLGHHRCMTGISAEEVAKILENIIERVSSCRK